jgi:inorganic triphosphatase YgiF
MIGAMQEIELKYQVPLVARVATEAWVVKGSTRRQRLQAAYFDTEGRHLARAGLALRLRLEGRHWVQTLKGGGDDGMTRLEHEVQLDARGKALPALDPARHAGTPAGERLLALLATPDAGPLHCLYQTDIVRLTRTLRAGGARIEIAYDRGHLVAEREGQLLREPVCELELELLSGSPQALLDAARQHALQLGLWLDLRSKAELGDLLARGLAMAAPQQATAVPLRRGMGVAQGLHAVLLGCLPQILRNASQIAAGQSTAEHLHQLRIGLRRLRSALTLFDGLDELQPVQEAMAAVKAGVEDWFDRLGALRDAEVRAGLFAAELDAAWQAQFPNAAAGPRDQVDQEALVALLRDRGVQGLLLALVGLVAVLGELAASAEQSRLRPLLRPRLRHWLEPLQSAAPALDQFDEAQRHQLRRRIKRLRYALEFAAGLFADADELLDALRRAQQALGDWLDLDGALALRRQAGAAPADAAADALRNSFELGWLSAQQTTLQAQARRRMRQLRRIARRFELR